MHTYLIVFVVALLASAALVATQHWHGHYSLDSSFGVQNHHTEPTPRVGGIAIALGLFVAWLLAAPDVRALLGPMLLAGIPAFAFGLAEDITKKVGVQPRLLATMSSGVLAWYLTGVSMQDTGLPPLDWMLRFTPLAVLFTAFAVGGVANAINIIDGFNGLAAGAVAIMLGAIGLIALNLGDAPLATMCFVVAVCALGFGAVNWPLGKIFLGDGGAYLLGFVLAWVAVLLPMRHTEINAWATILVCAYPVLEVGFSVRRRRNRVGHQAGQPDKVHLHHLIHRRIVCKAFPKLHCTLKNGLTSPWSWLGTALPAVWAVVFAQNTPMLVLAFGGLIFGYAAIYARLTQFRWCFSARTIRPAHVPALLIAKTTKDSHEISF
jgi:UDP-N-acetylmuramyl pentapeptide phosphotransferase/UDP-N-acetylglucosamine-1-phosphate transferase